MDWFITDHLGSTKLLIDQNGQHRFTGDDDPFGINLRSFGDKDTHRYTGQILDEEQGVYYYGARYYLPEIGRFISGDPLQQFSSLYVYVGNHPILSIDPTGGQEAPYRMVDGVRVYNKSPFDTLNTPKVSLPKPVVTKFDPQLFNPSRPKPGEIPSVHAVKDPIDQPRSGPDAVSLSFGGFAGIGAQVAITMDKGGNFYLTLSPGIGLAERGPGLALTYMDTNPNKASTSVPEFMRGFSSTEGGGLGGGIFRTTSKDSGVVSTDYTFGCAGYSNTKNFTFFLGNPDTPKGDSRPATTYATGLEPVK